MRPLYLAAMHAINTDLRDTDRLPNDHGRLLSGTGVHRARMQWQPNWWIARLAPTPSWLERLERGTPLPGLLRR